MVRTSLPNMSALIVLGLTFGAPTVALAQMPPDIAEKIAALGRVVDPVNTAKIYAPLAEKEPYASVKVTRDVKYGVHPRNILDIFVDDTSLTGRPVLMFVHGGGITTAITKSAPGRFFWDNLALFAARNGMVGVNVEYRPGRDFPWPAGAEDVGGAVRYVADHIANFGGDASRIYLMGDSAGAQHAAAYVAHPEFHGRNGSGLAGAIFVSGTYDLTKLPMNDVLAYYGPPDSKLYGERSSFNGLLKTKTPFMLAAAELNPPEINEQFAELKDAMCKTERGCVHSVMLAKHSHMSEVFAINTSDISLTSHVLEFIRTRK
jgi:acetyl esterase/lipase